MIETRLLRNAIILAEHRNFARAAKALNISQPTLTRNIQTLESHIGARLFDRKSRVILPTPVGDELLKHARLIISSTLALEDGIQHFMGLETGTISIGTSLYAASSLGTAIGLFNDQHPNIKISIEVANWPTLYDRLRNAEFDFALTETRELNKMHDLETQNLAPYQAFLFCRYGHPLLKTTLPSPSDLLQFPFILPTLPVWVLALFRQFFKKTVDELVSIEQITSIKCNEMSVMKDTVASSNAIGMATYGTVSVELQKKQFVALPFLIPGLNTNYGILKKQGHTLSPAASAFTNILIDIDATLSKQETPLIESLSKAT